MSIIDRLRNKVPRVTEYFDPWVLRQDVLQKHADKVNHLNLEEHVASMQDFLKEGPRDVGWVDNGIGILDVQGVLMKQETSLGASTSTIQLRKKLREFAKDESVKSIIMHIDSPGGSAAGIQEMADEIERTKALGKPVHAVVDGQCCSGAYWIASAASSIQASPSSVIGSIGVYTVVEDTSAAAEAAGVKVHVVKAGEYKAVGEPGTEVTQDQLDTLRKNLVEPTYQQFTQAVAKGRSMSKSRVATLATGEFWQTEQAISLGLVDAVSDADDFVRQLQEDLSMSDESNKPKAASLGELKAALVGASAEFILAQAEKGATLVDALTAHTAEMSARLQAERTAREESEKQAKVAAELAVESKISAAKSKTEDSDESSEPIGYQADLAAFDKLFQAELAKCKNRSTAYSRVANGNPDLMSRLMEAGDQIKADRARNAKRFALND